MVIAWFALEQTNDSLREHCLLYWPHFPHSFSKIIPPTFPRLNSLIHSFQLICNFSSEFFLHSFFYFQSSFLFFVLPLLTFSFSLKKPFYSLNQKKVESRWDFVVANFTKKRKIFFKKSAYLTIFILHRNSSDLPFAKKKGFTHAILAIFLFSKQRPSNDKVLLRSNIP